MKLTPRKTNQVHMIVLTLLIIDNICFYTEDTLIIYLILALVSLLLEFSTVLFSFTLHRLHINSCIIWLLAIYGIFTYNGLLRLKFGTYNWDMMLFTCVQNIAIYFALKSILKSDEWYERFKTIVYTSGWFTFFIIVRNELQDILAGTVRIGDTLSGNVITVGVYLGILSVFMAIVCSKERKIFYWISFLLIVVAMLATGSKITIMIIAVDLLLFIDASKHKQMAILVTGVTILVSVFLVFNVQYFYNLIGFRIEDMLFQMLGVGPGHYSHSTEGREIMIKEGLRFMWDYPLFGGGEKYFGSKTSTQYSYSHCNYIELLVNFGFVGFLFYYFPIIRNLRFMTKTRRYRGDLAKLCIALMALRLIVDFTMMTHSEPCVGYFPMILSFVYVDIYKSSTLKEYALCPN